ncbi:MAG: hypothetical protein JNG88_17300 [Phycisphaerales bacterium]|nr:hypothetical protein [Phycisphaerales bacterium]
MKPRIGRSMSARCAARAAVLLGLLTGGAAAQTGPDVIVGDLPATAHYGPLSGVHAYAVGTTSCNLGDQPLEWVDNTNQHPVITQNVYRLSNGRFEQLGQGWMKHGFCALQGTVCSACTPGGSCAALFPGCSDPYSASLNGSQSGLGSKMDVNATTGAFPYPFTGQGASGDALFKRIRVNESDLTTPGALYFVSSHYVHPDEPAFGTQYNNKSYRRVTVGTGFVLNVADTTQRQKYALQAWQAHDTGVQLTNVDVAGDGRFVFGVKVIDLGGGAYRYEYAVENYNSHRSGYSFRVPFPTGTVVTNAGFRDVDYHSGDPVDNTNWNVSITSSDISWTAPTTFAQNPNSNALRWDTIYNFWFEANAPASSGAVTLTLFRPGTPTDISATLPIPGTGGGPTPPANDMCANAISVSPGTLAFSTVNATTDGPVEPTACSFNGFDDITNDVWYRYTAPCDGTAVFSLCGSGFNTKLAVYAGSCPSAASAIGCNDDACGTASEVSIAVTANASYLLRVGGVNGATGSGTLTVTGPTCTPTGPFNDLCQNRAGVGIGVTPFDTTGATTDGPPHAGCNFFSYDQVGNDIWFNFPSTINGSLTVSLCGSGFDTKLAVYDDAGCANLESRLLACDDDTCGLQSEVIVNVVSGRNYTIRVGGYNGATGVGQLTLSAVAAPTESTWVVFTGTTVVPGVGNAENEDVVAYDGASQSWNLIFDGSDVGLSTAVIDGMAVLPGGDILLSFADARSIPGITGGPSGSTTVDDSDIVRFHPTSLGATTAGTFAFYFDGSDVGLTQNDEDIDAIALLPDGRLLISTNGTVAGRVAARTVR